MEYSKLMKFVVIVVALAVAGAVVYKYVYCPQSGNVQIQSSHYSPSESAKENSH